MSAQVNGHFRSRSSCLVPLPSRLSMGASPLQGHLTGALPVFARAGSIHGYSRCQTARRSSRASAVAMLVLIAVAVNRHMRRNTSSASAVLLGGSSPRHKMVWIDAALLQLLLLKAMLAIVALLVVLAVALLGAAAVAKLRKRCLADAHTFERQKTPRCVSFHPDGSGRLVADLTEIPDEVKAKMWWTEKDYTEFLRVRVHIGKAYRTAAKKMGVDVGGAYPPIPELRHESRRGLGLGRKAQRARNRDRYLDAILNEQRRQRESRPHWFDDAGRITAMDLEEMEVLSRVAARFSEEDRIYAHSLGKSYWEQDERDRKTEEEQSNMKPNAVKRVNSGFAIMEEPDSEHEEDDALRRSSASYPSVREMDQSLALEQRRDFTYQLEDKDNQIRRLASAAKGHGLSADKLRQVGLAATGHHLSKAARQHWRKLGKVKIGSVSDEAEVSAAETDDDGDGDGEEESGPSGDLAWAEYGTPSDYRTWRLRNMGRISGEIENRIKSPVISEYGTPQEYMAWRELYMLRRRSSGS